MMVRTPRIVAAALTPCATLGLVLVALISGTAHGSPAALVTLQVAPRGPGVVSVSPAGVDSGGQPVTGPCDRNQESDSCSWQYPTGTTVRLTATPDSGKSFSGWSSPDCAGAGPCSLTLDSASTSIAALFSPLRLGVVLSTDPNDPDKTNGGVTSSPGGIDCHQRECFANFAPHTRVTLTATPDPGQTFKGWNPGCESVTQTTCTIAVEDQPTWVGATFDDEDQPQLATTISVQFQVRKGGSGQGTVSSSRFVCGGQCSAEYGYAVDAVDAAGNRSPKATIRAAASACPFSARVAKVRVLRSGKTRTVAVTLNASGKTRARLALKRAGRTVATAAFAVRSGTSVLRLRVPRSVPGGAARLTILVNVPGGGVRTYSRGVSLPKSR